MLPIDEVSIVSSTGALSLKSVPKHLVIIGAGYIGLELGSVWRRLGSLVTIIEYADTLLGQMDADVVRVLQTSLEKEGIIFKFGHSVVGITKHEVKGPEFEAPSRFSKSKPRTTDFRHASTEPEIYLHVLPKNAPAATPELMSCDTVLVAAGRKPNTQSLGLETINVQTDAKGYITVNERYETNIKGIYAIGDCINGPMLAHKAMDEGVALAEQLAGQAGSVNYDVIPAVIFTHPEIATVGKNETELKAMNVVYKIGKFPFNANGRARTIGETAGFVKILTDEKTDLILGCAIVGADAGALIAQIAAIMEFGGTAEDVARTCHAHPTLNETVKEAAWAAFAKPLHS